MFHNKTYLIHFFLFASFLFSGPLVFGQVIEGFESGSASGWVTSGTSSSGTFIVGNPTQETSTVVTQPEDDHTPAPGVNAYFTATNTSAGNQDVDGGVSITTSPIFNVSSASTLSIWYFHGQRDTGDDGGDFFRLEYSLNGGSSYATLVFIGDVRTVAIWTEATTAIPAGSDVRIRVSVSDGTGGGDIIEGGIDDLSITSASPAIQIDDVSVNESAGTATFTATHVGANTTIGFTVNYETSDITTTAGLDYTTTNGTLNFNGTSGDTDQITVPIINNPAIEPNETYLIQFTVTSDSSVDISDTATGSIEDSYSDNPRAYEEREAINLMGNFKMKGNTNLECVSNCPTTPVSNNPGVTMGYIDVDTDGSTVNSSSTTLTLPPGASVEWAGLYWGGMFESSRSNITNPPGTLNIDQVKLREPGAGGYTTIDADVRNIESTEFTDWSSFMAHADITSQVQAGGSGTYLVADIALATGRSFTGPYGGWTMVVVYTDPTEKARRINIWDGFDFFGFGDNDNFTVTGLLTPSSGTFETHAGYFAFDGEVNSTGDFVSINSTTLSNVFNPNNNTLNGTISEFGIDVGARNPNFDYSWGIDADIFDASGLVSNSATTVDVVLGSANEGLWGGVFVVSNEIAFPAVSSKSFTPTTIFLGDEATVTLIVDNPAQGVSLTNFSLTDNLPSGMTISTTPNATSTCGGTLTASSGSNSFTASGITLPAGSTCSLTFDVVTNDLGSYLNILSPDDITNDQNIPLAGESSGLLSVNVRTVITNRRITHRVKNN